jgi:protein SCO1/2
MNECKQFLNIRFFKNGRSATSPWSKPLAKNQRLFLALLLTILLSACQNETATTTDQTADQNAASSTAQSQNANAPSARLELQTGTISQDRRQLTDFALLDATGAAFGRQELLGQWSLLFFGFTRCPDICPPTLSQLTAIQRRLANHQAQHHDLVSEPLQTVFISVDTQHDQPAVIASYLDHFRDAETEAEMLVGLTGDMRQVKALAVQLGVAFEVHTDHSQHQHGNHQQVANNDKAKTPDQANGETQVNHSGAVILLDPEARIHAIFPPPLAPAAAMHDDLIALLRADTSRP